MIEVDKISKVYSNGRCALHDVSFTVTSGIIGLIGPNGAGKTTLMRILATLIRPTQGSARVFGFNVEIEQEQQKIRDVLGYLPQETGIHPTLSVEQNLDYFAILKRMEDRRQRSREIDHVLEQTGLTEARNARAETLSGGMKRRLGIAITLLNQPRIIIVDEPTAGLDPAERVRFRNVLAELAGNRLVLLSSHIVQDIEQLSSQLIVLHQGYLLFHGSLNDLINSARGHIWAVDKTLVARNFEADSPLLGIQSHNGILMQRMIAEGRPSSDAVEVIPTLEDAYLYMMYRFQSTADNLPDALPAPAGD